MDVGIYCCCRYRVGTRGGWAGGIIRVTEGVLGSSGVRIGRLCYSRVTKKESKKSAQKGFEAGYSCIYKYLGIRSI